MNNKKKKRNNVTKTKNKNEIKFNFVLKWQMQKGGLWRGDGVFKDIANLTVEYQNNKTDK